MSETTCRPDAAPPAGTGQEETEINLLELLSVLVRRKKLIIAMTLVAALVSIAYSLAKPNIYKAATTIIPPSKEGGGGFSSLVGQGGALAGLAGLGSMGGSAELYMSLLKSRSVADGVIATLNLQKEYDTRNLNVARQRLASQSSYQLGQKDGIISISVTDSKPELAARIANAYVDELGKAVLRLNLGKASTERSFLEKRIHVVKQDLKGAEDVLKEFASKNRAIQVDSQAKASIEAVAKLKAELVTREVQLSALRTTQTDESPEVKSLLTAITRLRREIGRHAGDGGDGEGVPSVGSVPSLGLQHARLMRNVKVQEAIFEQLSKQFEVAKLTEAKESANIQVIDAAEPPVHKFKPKRALIVIVTTISAFFASILTAFLLEYLDKLPPEDRRTLDEIRDGLRLPLPRRS